MARVGIAISRIRVYVGDGLMHVCSEGGGDARDGIRDKHALLTLYVWVLVGLCVLVVGC